MYFLFIFILSQAFLILYTTHDVILIYHLVIFVLFIFVMRRWSSRHENSPYKFLIIIIIIINHGGEIAQALWKINGN